MHQNAHKPRRGADQVGTPAIGTDSGAIHIGLGDGPRVAVAALLAKLLADQHVLYQKTRMCQWNLVGGRFDSLHRLFETQYEELAEDIDQTAERIRMLDQAAPAGMAELLEV
ncbi:MAG: ferritin-like domain-containing protein, partial [Planctomycetota bacterium]